MESEKKFLDQQKIFKFGICKKNESIHDIFKRVAKSISKIEKSFSNNNKALDFEKRIINLLEDKKVIPNTTILMNAGRFNKEPLSACSVPPVDLKKNLKKVKKTVDNFHLNGMGTGFNFDDLKNPIDIIEHLNQIGIEGQNNKKQLRPVGNMGTISINHPQILNFIKIKIDDKDKQWIFNFSINISNNALKKIKNKETIKLKNGKNIAAEKLLNKISESILISGDPGLVFVDRLNQDNQVISAGKYESLAPCGEIGLTKGETCQFSYINLGKFVKNKKINYFELKETINDSIRFLDNIVEYNISKYSNKISQNITKDKRKIGLGVCGFSDMLNKLKIDYKSKKARNIAEDLFSFINFISKEASVNLAKERGSFRKYKESKYVRKNNIIIKYAKQPTNTVSRKDWLDLDKKIKKNGIRNCATIALPPTGRSSLLIKASQSIEPSFKNTLKISPNNQLLMLASIQKFVDESISKTINIPENYTVKKIKEIIKKAINLPLKGITIYRDKSRSFQPIKLNK